MLILAIKTLPLGTAYAVWTGMGAVGVAILGIFLFKESADWMQIDFHFVDRHRHRRSKIDTALNNVAFAYVAGVESMRLSSVLPRR